MSSIENTTTFQKFLHYFYDKKNRQFRSLRAIDRHKHVIMIVAPLSIEISRVRVRLPFGQYDLYSLRQSGLPQSIVADFSTGFGIIAKRNSFVRGVITVQIDAAAQFFLKQNQTIFQQFYATLELRNRIFLLDRALLPLHSGIIQMAGQG